MSGLSSVLVAHACTRSVLLFLIVCVCVRIFSACEYVCACVCVCVCVCVSVCLCVCVWKVITDMHDDKGDWIFTEEPTSRGGQVSFAVTLNGSGVIGTGGKWDRAIFSCSPSCSGGQVVFMHRFQLPEGLRYNGLGPRALAHILDLYHKASCDSVEVASPTKEGKQCYSKLGFKFMDKDKDRMQLQWPQTQPQSLTLLSGLLHKGGRGRPSLCNDQAAQKRRVTRTDQQGLAQKMAVLFECILADVNKQYQLDKYPVTLRETMVNMHTEGRSILEECKTTTRDRVLAQAGLNVLEAAGRAHTGTVLGVMSAANSQGKLKNKDMAEITGKSASYLRKCARQVSDGGFSTFGSTNKSAGHKVQALCPTRLNPEFGECKKKDCKLLHDCQCCRNGSRCSAASCKKWNAVKAARADKARVKKASRLTRMAYNEAELVATKAWMTQQNPARSGDQKEICWMVKGRFDFYHEDYRSLPLEHTYACTHNNHAHTYTFVHTHINYHTHQRTWPSKTLPFTQDNHWSSGDHQDCP